MFLSGVGLLTILTSSKCILLSDYKNFKTAIWRALQSYRYTFNLTTLLWVFGYSIVITVVFFFFFPVFPPILWCSHIGNHPQEEFTKFGYRSETKVGKQNADCDIYIWQCWKFVYKFNVLSALLENFISSLFIGKLEDCNKIVCFHFFSASWIVTALILLNILGRFHGTFGAYCEPGSKTFNSFQFWYFSQEFQTPGGCG